MKRTQPDATVTASAGELQVHLPLRTRTAAADGGEVHVVFVLEGPEPKLEQQVIHYLSDDPLELAQLVQRGRLAGLATQLPEAPPWAAQDAPLGACSCGRSGCAHVTAAADLAAAHWAQQPLLRLSALGLAPERLQAAVFAAWAAAAPPGAAELPEAAYQGDTGRALREGPGLAEWLAEAAEQDRMHVPGPQFHDVKVNLTSVGNPGQGTPAPDARDWTQLLPGVPGAAAAVARIAARASERSQEQAETVNRRAKSMASE